MKNLIAAAALVFSIPSFAAPFSTRQDNTICTLADAVQVTASGAAGAKDVFNAPLDDEWHDLNRIQGLSASSVTWPGFPTIMCDFQGIDTAVALQKENGINSEVTFNVGPPQALTSAKCLCG